MPLSCEINIGKNAPVRLLNAVMERMDYSELYAAYSRLGRIEYSPKILMKIMVYGYMRKQISSRALEACCRENLHFMYLMEGQRNSYGKTDHDATFMRMKEDHMLNG